MLLSQDKYYPVNYEMLPNNVPGVVCVDLFALARKRVETADSASPAGCHALHTRPRALQASTQDNIIKIRDFLT